MISFPFKWINDSKQTNLCLCFQLISTSTRRQKSNKETSSSILTFFFFIIIMAKAIKTCISKCNWVLKSANKNYINMSTNLMHSEYKYGKKNFLSKNFMQMTWLEISRFQLLIPANWSPECHRRCHWESYEVEFQYCIT